MLFNQSIPEEAINTIMKVTPTTMAGYGLALAVLALGCYILYKKWTKADEELLSLTRLTLDLVAKVEIRLQDQQSIMEDIRAIKQEIMKR